MQFNRPQSRVDVTHLYFNRDKAIIDTLFALPTHLKIQFFLKAISDPKQPLMRIVDTSIIIELKNHLFEMIKVELAQMKELIIRGEKFDDKNLQSLITVIHKLLNQDAFLADESLNYDTYIEVLTYSSNHKIIADIFQIFGKTSFDRNKTLVFYYILSYIKHWNNHNDRHYTLVDVLHIHPDFCFEYIKNGQTVSIKRPANINAHYPECSFYQITLKIVEQQQMNIGIQDPIFHELLCKVRLATTNSTDKSEVVRGVLSAYRIFSFMDLMWYRTNPNLIPNIFELPPNYVEIFKQVLELFLHPQCTLGNRIVILDLLKVVITFEVRRGQSDILVSLLQNYILLQNFLNDMKDFIQNKKTKYIDESNFKNTDFVLKVLKLFDNLDSGLVLDSTSDILQGYFYSPDSNDKIIEGAGLLIINSFLEENTETQMTEFIFKEIKKQDCQHTVAYVKVLIQLLSDDVRQRTTQRRDSTALARTITDSQIFDTLIKRINSPYKADSLQMRVIELTASVCCQNPLLSQVLYQPICQILKGLKDINNYPTGAEQLSNIVQFLHNISLKQGKVRERVQNQNIVTTFMEIFLNPEFSNSIAGKHLNNLIGSIQRFQSNITQFAPVIFKGVLLAFQKVYISCGAFNIKMLKIIDSKQENWEQHSQSIKYEQLSIRITALFKLAARLYKTSPMFVSQSSVISLSNYKDRFLTFRYLNIHNPLCNKQIIRNNPVASRATVDKYIKALLYTSFMFVPLEFMHKQKELKGSLDHIFSSNFFDMLHRSKAEPDYKIYLSQYSWMSLFERISFSILAEDSYTDEALFACSKFMHLLSDLDQFRAMEDVYHLNRRISKLKKNFSNDKQKMDFLKYHLKNIRQRDGPFSMAHQCLRKALILITQKKSQNLIKQNGNYIMQDMKKIMEMKFSNTLQCIYLLKLKVQNIQYLLNSLGLAPGDFPMQFSSFVFFYNYDSYDVLVPLIKIATFFYYEPCQKDKNWLYIFRLELLTKIMAIIDKLISLKQQSTSFRQDEQIRDDVRIQPINYVVYNLQKSLIKLTAFLPKHPIDTQIELQQVMEKIVQGVMRNIKYIQDISTDPEVILVKPKIPFTINNEKKMDTNQFTGNLRKLFIQYKEEAIKQLQDYSISTYQYITTLFQGAFNQRLKLYQKKRVLNDLYLTTSTKILKISKLMFEDLVLDLGVKHPKEQLKESNAMKCVINVCVLLKCLIMIMEKIMGQQWFGRGQLQITPHYMSQVLRFVTSIIVNQAQIRQSAGNIDYDPYDKLVSKTMILIQTSQRYFVMQIQKKRKQELKEEQQQKEKFKSKAAKKNEKALKKQFGNKKIKQQIKVQQVDKKEKEKQKQKSKQKEGKKKKNKIKKLWQFNKQVTLFVESVVLESKKTAIMKNSTFQQLLNYIEIRIAKKDSTIELARFNIKNFNIFEVNVKDKDKTGLLILTLHTIIRMLPQSHHRIEIQAYIKRTFYQTDPKKVCKIPLETINALSSNVQNKDDFLKVVKKICIITQNDVQNPQPAQYDKVLNDSSKYSVILKPSVDYVTIVTKYKKNKKFNHKKSINKQEINTQNQKPKTLDYIPEGNVADFIRQLIDFTIEHIVTEAIQAHKTQGNQTKSAFNSIIAVYALQTLLRICPTLIPFITRYRCKRAFNNIPSQCQQLTKITGGSIRLQQTDMTFVGFLVRVAAPLMFDRVQYLFNEICADNYILVNSYKDVVVPLGQYVRSKIIREMSSFDINQNPTKTISYLNLLTHLLKFREFNILALQQGVVQILHKQTVALQKQGYQREPYLQFFNLLTQPLTILHSFNIQLQISKFKPLQMRTKTLSFKAQLIPLTCFKGNKFYQNWPYSSVEPGQINESGDQLNQLPHGEDFDRNSFITQSQSQSLDELDSSDQEGSIRDSQVFLNNQMMEEIQEQSAGSRGWTSHMGHEEEIGYDHEFDDDFDDGDDEGLEEILELDEEDSNQDIEIEDMDSEEIMDELYGDQEEQIANEDDLDYLDDFENSEKSHNFRDVHTILVGMISMEAQYGNLASFYVRFMSKIRDILNNQKNVLANSIDKQSSGGKLLHVARCFYKQISNNSHNVEQIPKFRQEPMTSPIFQRRLYDDSQNIGINRRRNGQLFGGSSNIFPDFVMVGQQDIGTVLGRDRGITTVLLRRNRPLQEYNYIQEIQSQELPAELPQESPNQVLTEQVQNQQPQQQTSILSLDLEDIIRRTQAILRDQNQNLLIQQQAQQRGQEQEQQILQEQQGDQQLEQGQANQDYYENLLNLEQYNMQEERPQNNAQQVLQNLSDDRVRQLLRQNQFDEDYFYSLAREGREEILQNMLGMVEYGREPEQQQQQPNQMIVEQNNNEIILPAVNNAEQVVQGQVLPQVPETGRRKISMQYHKKIQKDPKQLIIKEKKQNKVYICEDDFLETVLNIIYFDLYDFGTTFPYIMLKNLCTNSINESKLLSCLLIILKHPNLRALKQQHNQPSNKFPKSVLIQRNNELITDYQRQGYHQVSQKVLYILSHLSRSNPSGMLLSSHNKVDFLPEWYYVEELPYYKHLIHLIKTPHFKNNRLLGELTDILFNIVNHHSMRYIHALEHKQSVEFQMKLEKQDIELLCFLLYGEYSETKSDEVIKNIVLLLCVDDSNLKMFIDTFEQVVDSLSKKSMQLLRNQISQQYTNEDKLHNILRIVASMFQDQYQAKIEKKNLEKNKIKQEVLRQFKRVLECPSLIELFKLCSELSINYPKKVSHLERIQVILATFFVVYNIVLVEEQQQLKTIEISKMEELNSIKKVSVNGPLFGIEVERALGQVFNILKTNAKPMINHLLKQSLNNLKKSHRSKDHPTIFSEPIVKILSKNSTLIDYENKRAMFKAELKTLRKNLNNEQINLNVVRQNVLLSSMNQVMPMNQNQLMNRFHITFDGQEGEDVGGLTREWFTLLSREIFNPHYALFTPSSTGSTYQPRPDSYVNSNHLLFFKFIGRIVGKALHDGYLLDAYFTPAFYKHILGKPLSLNDLQEQDYEFYKNLDWVLKNDIADLDLTFCYQEQYFGKIEVKDLIPNGRNIPVTEDNKVEYVQRRCYARMATAVEKQIESFLVGFHELIPHKLISLFEHKELQLMISGLPTIDILDLKDNTQLVNYEKTDNIIIWLFEVLEGFDNNLRASFLQFVTGTSRVPSDGFKALRGMNGSHKFTIQKDFGIQKLPRAHTCFNQLDLPDYPSKEILIEKLTMAITEGREGFGFI